MKQEPPFAIQLEPTEGCNLACSFCALQSIRDNGADAVLGMHGKVSAPYRFMDFATVMAVAKETRRLNWNPRWEFAMHGEPTMNKDLDAMIEEVRRQHPKGYIMVTSNGGGLLKWDKIEALFDAGLNTLALDLYNHAPHLERLRESVKDFERFGDGIPVFKYPQMAVGNPHKRHHGQFITLVNDISENSAGTHQITNQGGNSGVAELVEQRCAKPFRELSVRWDGSVALCCDDWKGEYKIANVNNMALDALWNHPRFEAARRKLYHAQRDFGPCNGCNVRTYRNGLLPDKYGKEELPLPGVLTAVHIKEALRGKVFSIKLAGKGIAK